MQLVQRAVHPVALLGADLVVGLDVHVLGQVLRVRLDVHLVALGRRGHGVQEVAVGLCDLDAHVAGVGLAHDPLRVPPAERRG
eukprot:8687158-Alexandrium_andersonii.AAC.2